MCRHSDKLAYLRATCVTAPTSRLLPVSGIGVLREGPLHAAIKAMLAVPGDQFEVPIGGFVIDLVRADGELVEVQTGGFSALGRKLDALLDTHRFRIVYPVAAERRIVRVDGDGQITSVRRSPKRASVVDVFDRLVAFPSLLTHPHLTIEMLLLREDHVRGGRPERVGHRRWDPGERRLIDVLERVEVRGPGDLVRILPALPPDPFSTRELAAILGCSVPLAQRSAYCLRMMGIIEAAGKRGRAPLHRQCPRARPAAAEGGGAMVCQDASASPTPGRETGWA
jgi:hypothetical protein